MYIILFIGGGGDDGGPWKMNGSDSVNITGLGYMAAVTSGGYRPQNPYIYPPTDTGEVYGYNYVSVWAVTTTSPITIAFTKQHYSWQPGRKAEIRILYR